MTESAFPIFRALGDHGVLVEFASQASEGAREKIRRLDAALAAAPFPGFAQAVPAIASLLVDFDLLATDHAAVEAAVRRLLAETSFAPPPPARREILVCYDGAFAPDLPQVAAACGLSREAAAAAHLAGRYRVQMYGFAPGYAYLDGLPAALRLPRKPTAVRDVPAGSVLIAGGHCIVATLTMPTGWWVVGRSPTKILRDDAARPFLFDVGDEAVFRRIRRDAFDSNRD